MNKVIALSQASCLVPDRRELVDMLDQRLTLLLAECGYIPVQTPNYFPLMIEADPLSEAVKLDCLVREWLESTNVQGVVLTGGKDFGIFPDRDKTEHCLLSWATEFNRPVLGICRGMQHLVKFHGGAILRTEGHAGTTHKIVNQSNGDSRIVNSFHDFAIYDLPDEFDIIDRAEDGSIESLKHRSLPFFGIMWHPERENVFALDDISLIKTVLQ